MAGFYPDPPAHRLAWDSDGTELYSAAPGGNFTVVSQSLMETLNDDETSGTNHTYIEYAFRFPQAMDLTHYLVRLNISNPTVVIEASNDTTNGRDGTWDTISSPATPTTSGTTGWWRYPQAMSALGYLWLRIRVSYGATYTLSAIHLYGKPTAATGDRVELWDPSADQRLGEVALDWGDIPRGQTQDRTFRVKNLSASQTAQGVVLSLEALTDGTPSHVTMHTLSQDGLSFSATQNIGDLAPGAISPQQTVRFAATADAPLGPRVLRVVAEPTGWA